MSLASRRWGRAEKRGQILVDDPRFVKAFSMVNLSAKVLIGWISSSAGQLQNDEQVLAILLMLKNA
jgi:hypothetical protein